MNDCKLDPKIIQPQPNESNSAYINRLCTNKKLYQLTWQGLADLANAMLNLNYSETWYRKGYGSGDFGAPGFVDNFWQEPLTSGYIQVTPLPSIQDIESVTTTASSVITDEECDGQCASCENHPICVEEYYEAIKVKQEEMEDTLLAIKKERIKVSDERTQERAYLRRISREETLKEIATEYAATMDKNLRLPIPAYKFDEFKYDKIHREGILLLSDWHYGMVCDNPWNKFDPDICKERVNKLLGKVVEYVTMHKIPKVTVFNLSDLIAGRIHTQIRIESRFDVITQTMEVSEILAEFLNQLSIYCEVDYYDTLDNHSRLEPNKNESMDLESLTRMIPWYLIQRLASNPNIHIKENEFGYDIITCEILGHNVIAVHGDHDSPTTGLDKLTLQTRRSYDLFCTAHRHHCHMEEKNHALIIGNSSLMGTDSYAEKLRLSNDPSQTFIIASTDNVCECLYRIVLK